MCCVCVCVSVWLWLCACTVYCIRATRVFWAILGAGGGGVHEGWPLKVGLVESTEGKGVCPRLGRRNATLAAGHLRAHGLKEENGVRSSRK